MQNREAVPARLGPVDLLPNTSHHYLQLMDSSQLSYVSNLDRMTPRTLNLLRNKSGVLSSEIRRTKKLPPPTDFCITSNIDAIEFVESTIGPVANTGLYGTPENYNPTGLGYTSAILGSIAIRPCLDQPGSRQAIAAQSALVHEQAHSTAVTTRKVTLIDIVPSDDSDETWAITKSAISVGMQKNKIQYDRGNNTVEMTKQNCFLEEAFAEETASRYRASLHKNNNTTVEVACEDSATREMPVHYFSIGESDPSHVQWVASAFAAHAVHLLSEHSGIDMYDLMILSRDPKYEVEAKRDIVQAIERVEKGLYRTLREMPYPDDSNEFFEVYDKIVALTSTKQAAKPLVLAGLTEDVMI